MKAIIIFGPPGSGKGTQAKLLSEKLNLLHISTGDLLRQEIAQQTKLGKEITSLMEKGNLVSDEIVLSMIKDFLIKNNEKDVILDGFPRTLPQALELLKIVENLDVSSIRVINLNIDEEEIIQRLLLRAQIEKRADDNLATVKDRLNVYYSQTKPILDFFRSQNVKILEFNGKGTIEDIQREITKKLI